MNNQIYTQITLKKGTESYTFNSVHEACKALGCSRPTFSVALRKKNPEIWGWHISVLKKCDTVKILKQ